MSEYYYDKVVDGEILKDILMLDDLWPKIVSVSTGFFQESPANNLKIITTEILISTELDDLAVIINSYGPTHLMVQRYVKLEQAYLDLSFGVNLTNLIRAKTMVMQYSTMQRMGMITELSTVISMLGSGMIDLAYAELVTLPATMNVTQDDIDEGLRRMEVYLGYPLT